MSKRATDGHDGLRHRRRHVIRQVLLSVDGKHGVTDRDLNQAISDILRDREDELRQDLMPRDDEHLPPIAC